jgi:FxsC-like protein
VEAPAAAAVPYFYLSYAQSPENATTGSSATDAWQGKLFEDLCDQVTELVGLPAAAAKYVGFMSGKPRDRHDHPSAELGRALATCRAFVPLFSRRYFDSDECGKEWFAFNSRALNSTTRGGSTAGAIIPALWVPVDADYLPAAVRAVQFNHAELGERYAATGFYGIIKLTRYRDAYDFAIGELARRIVRAAEKSPVAPDTSGVYYASLVSAFGPERSRIPGGRPLRITIVAPRRSELAREDGTIYYGHDACGWNPYAPESVRRLADHAADLARNLGFRPHVGDLSQHRDELLSSAPPSSPEVLIVDAWAATIDEYAGLLRRVDAMNNPWVQVVVPWNPGDKETEAAGPRLRSVLGSALGHKLTEGRATSLSAVHGVPTLDDFSRVLPAVIMTAARQYLRHADPFPPPGDAETERPRLRLPLPDLSNTELSGA